MHCCRSSSRTHTPPSSSSSTSPAAAQLLSESKAIIEDGDWAQLRLLLSRVLGTPNDAKETMFACVAYIEDAKAAQRADDMVSARARLGGAGRSWPGGAGWRAAGWLAVPGCGLAAWSLHWACL